MSNFKVGDQVELDMNYAQVSQWGVSQSSLLAKFGLPPYTVTHVIPAVGGDEEEIRTNKDPRSFFSSRFQLYQTVSNPINSFKIGDLIDLNPQPSANFAPTQAACLQEFQNAGLKPPYVVMAIDLRNKECIYVQPITNISYHYSRFLLYAQNLAPVTAPGPTPSQNQISFTDLLKRIPNLRSLDQKDLEDLFVGLDVWYYSSNVALPVHETVYAIRKTSFGAVNFKFNSQGTYWEALDTDGILDRVFIDQVDAQICLNAVNRKSSLSSLSLLNTSVFKVGDLVELDFNMNNPELKTQSNVRKSFEQLGLKLPYEVISVSDDSARVLIRGYDGDIIASRFKLYVATPKLKADTSNFKTHCRICKSPLKYRNFADWCPVCEEIR